MNVTETRFEFGRNWRNFLGSVSEAHVAEAEKSLRAMLAVGALSGRSFLDAGCGSGLFSVAARRLGAKVRSFDFDDQAVACAEEMKRRFCRDDHDWVIEKGDVLDDSYCVSLGTFDIVYSWGVLHHTGGMHKAIKNAASLVKPGGFFHLAIYNDQGVGSHAWRAIKKLYNKLPEWIRPLLVSLLMLRLWGPTTIRDVVHGRPFHTWRNYATNRGMSPWHDVVDWVGGYPFEVAKPGLIVEILTSDGFVPLRIKTCGRGHGCNEFVFQRDDK